MDRVRVIDVDRVEFTFGRTEQRPQPTLLAVLLLIAAQLACAGACAGATGPGPMMLLAMGLTVISPFLAYGAALGWSSDEDPTLVLEFHWTTIRLNGSPISRFAIRIDGESLTIGGHAVPLVDPELLASLRRVLADRDAILVAQAGGGVPPALDDLRRR